MAESKFALVIFDCDGVLVDSEPVSSRVFHTLVREAGLDLTLEETVAQFTGCSTKSSIEKVERLLGRPLPPTFGPECERRTIEALRDTVELIPGVREVLRDLGVPYCVASSGDIGKIRTTLGRTGLLPLFEGRIFKASDVTNGKPAPDLFLHAAKTLGVSPARCAVVEDSRYGVMAACAAGMTPFAFCPPPAAEQFRELGAVPFQRMSELLGLLGGRPTAG